MIEGNHMGRDQKKSERSGTSSEKASQINSASSKKSFDLYTREKIKELSYPKIEGEEISKQVVEHLKNVVGEIRIDDSKNGAIHGTSAEAIEHIIHTEKLAGHRSKLELDYVPGDISVFPTAQLVEAIALSDGIGILNDFRYRPEKFIEDAHGYAGDRALEHSFLKSVGIDISDEEARREAFFTVDESTNEDFVHDKDDDINYFLKKGISQKRIDKAIEETKERKGFLLAFSPAIKDLELWHGDPGANDIRIRSGEEGLPYFYISGIQPLGPYEENLLKKWGVTEDKSQTE